MRENVLAVLQREMPDVDFASEALVDDGVLDSLRMVEIIGLLSMEYGITIPYEEIVEENFNSVSAMAALVEKLGG